MKHDVQSASQSQHPSSVTMSICARPADQPHTAPCVCVINEPTDRSEHFHGSGIIGTTFTSAVAE